MRIGRLAEMAKYLSLGLRCSFIHIFNKNLYIYVQNIRGIPLRGTVLETISIYMQQEPLPRERKRRKTCLRAFCPFEIEMKELMHEGGWKPNGVPSSLLGKYDPLWREVTLRPDVNASVFFSSYKYFKGKHLFMESFVFQVGHCQYVLFNLNSAGKPAFFRPDSLKGF